MSKTSSDEGEPKENDKCISSGTNNDNGVGHCNEPEFTKKSKMSMLQERIDSAKNVINQRYRLIITILSVLVFLLLVVIIVLAVTLGCSSHLLVDRCESATCFRAAASVVSSVNKSHDPCTDFWSFSCEGWRRNNPIPPNKGIYSVRDPVKHQISHELRHYIDLIGDIDDVEPEWKVHRFYTTCITNENIDIRVLKHRIQKDFSGWDILNTYKTTTWDFTKVLSTLHGTYGVDAFFKVSVVPDDFTPGVSVVKIEPSGLGLPNRDYYYEPKYRKVVEGYKQFAADYTKVVATTSSEANTFANDMFNYEKRLADITPKPEKWQNPQQMYEKYRVRDLNTLMSRAKWLDFFQTVYPGAGIKENTVVLVAFPKYFERLSYVISTTDDKALNSYMVWRFAATYAPYMKGALVQAANEFHQKLQGIDFTGGRMAEERWEFCLRATTKFLNYAVGNLYLSSNKEIFPKAQEDLNRILTAISTKVLERVSQFTWIRDKDTENLARQKIENLRSSLGYPEFVGRHDDLREFYKDYIVQANFFQNVVDGVGFLRKREEARLKKTALSDSYWAMSTLDVSPDYVYSGNMLHVPIGFLRITDFNVDLPLAVRFGTLGFHVGAEIMKAFSIKGMQYESVGKLLDKNALSWLDTHSQYWVNTSSTCLTNDLEERADLGEYGKINPEMVLSQAFADIGALDIVFEAYKDHASKHGEDSVLPGLLKNNKELFFISFVQSMCENVNKEYGVIRYESANVLPAKQRVQLLFKQSKTFSSTFNCPAQSGRCQIW